MENIIYNELLCCGYSVDVGVVEVTEKNGEKLARKQCEINFVVNRGAKRYYIQSALSVSDPEKMETELRPPSMEGWHNHGCYRHALARAETEHILSGRTAVGGEK